MVECLTQDEGLQVRALSSTDFFSKFTFQKILSGTLSECQTVWIQIRTRLEKTAGLIWIQTV